MAQEEILPRETARVRQVVQISTMVHPEKDWAFIALCDDESLWLYHGSWSRIENIPQTTDLKSGLGEQSELNWRDVVADRKKASISASQKCHVLQMLQNLPRLFCMLRTWY